MMKGYALKGGCFIIYCLNQENSSLCPFARKITKLNSEPKCPHMQSLAKLFLSLSRNLEIYIPEGKASRIEERIFLKRKSGREDYQGSSRANLFQVISGRPQEQRMEYLSSRTFQPLLHGLFQKCQPTLAKFTFQSSL